MTFQLFFSFAGVCAAIAVPLAAAIGVYVRLAMRAELAVFLRQLRQEFLLVSLYDQKIVVLEGRLAALEIAVGSGAGV